MRFSMSMLLWTDNALDEKYLPILERLRKMGFDGVEIPIFTPDPDKYAALGKKLDNLGLARKGVTLCMADNSPSSPDPAIRKRGIEHLKAVLDCCRVAGMEMMGGPFYGPLGHFTGTGPTKDEWNWGVESIRTVAEYGRKLDVGLAIEYLNRFEIHLLNCAADTDRFVREVGIPGTGIAYDTFHANIEEKNVSRAIASCIANLKNVQISENDRSTPGSGGVRWEETFQALKAGGYDGWLTLEAFGTALPSLAAATRIWRKMFPDEESVARDGLAFMKRMWGTGA